MNRALRTHVRLGPEAVEQSCSSGLIDRFIGVRHPSVRLRRVNIRQAVGVWH